MNPKFQIDCLVEDTNSGQQGVIKGIRLIHQCEWPYDLNKEAFTSKGWEYDLWYLGLDYTAIDYHRYRYPDEPLSPGDYQTWKQWGWVKEADLLMLE